MSLYQLAMISLFILLTRLHTQQEPSKFDRLFPRPTGANAIEDYVRAGDLMDQGGFQIYQSWMPPETRPSPAEVQAEREARDRELAQMTPEQRKQDALDNPPKTRQELELIDHVNSLSYYRLKEEEVRRFGDALDYLAQGNRKAVSFDFQHTVDISWLSSVRKLARLSSDAAFVAFAAGQPNRASQFLNQSLVMSHRIGGDSIIAELSAIGNSSIALSRYNDHLGALSLAECTQIPPLVDQLVNDHDIVESMVQGERAEARRQLDAIMQSFKDGGSADASAARNEFRGMTPDQQSAWASQILQAADDQFALAARIFEQPEGTWLDSVGPEDPVSSAADDSYDPSKATLAQVGDDIRQTGNLTEHRQYLLAILRNHAQLRLLRLHARVIQHRWETGELPKTLEELKLPKDETSDPLSGKPFQYLLNDRTYRLLSLGVPETGPIELRYRRQVSGSSGTPANP